MRLLTLTGPGGVGKTRLALQIATDVRSTFADGVCFVSLASLCSINQVMPAIARALGLKPDHRSLARVQAVMRGRHFLLVLDNFEHIADAAPQLKKLLAVSPHLKILITSRSILRLLEEQVFYVTPLALPALSPLPSCEELAQVASVRLFLQRTRTAHPDFELTSENAQAVAQICTRLDGLPLALELAAARMQLFSPQSLLARLKHRLSFLTGGPCDAPERQRTLRRTMEWSYQLLTQEEQRLFRRLSVFVDGCSLRAIEAINDATDGRDPLLLDTLTSLLNQSLLQREAQVDNEEHRFTMLETIREYALECLQNSDEEEAICQAHAEYVALAKTRELKSPLREIVHTQPGDQAFSTAWNEEHSRGLERSKPPMICTSSPPPPEKVVVAYSHGLTTRENDVLRLLTRGLSSVLIGEQLFISLTTVNSHVRTIYNKLGVSSRSAATRYALEHHLV
jgi:predicted ATPase/DNA-binding CsgD family transcriptional regulator